MALTLSVSSSQIPDTFSILACPPKRPSTPVSLATLVTSKANFRNWSTILLTVFCNCRISPWAKTLVFRDKSPAATAEVTSEISLTWFVRFRAIALTLSMSERQTPVAWISSVLTWPPSLPLATSVAKLVTSWANVCNWSIMVLMVTFTLWISGSLSTSWICTFFERSPLATEVSTVPSSPRAF